MVQKKSPKKPIAYQMFMNLVPHIFQMIKLVSEAHKLRGRPKIRQTIFVKFWQKLYAYMQGCVEMQQNSKAEELQLLDAIGGGDRGDGGTKHPNYLNWGENPYFVRHVPPNMPNQGSQLPSSQL